MDGVIGIIWMFGGNFAPRNWAFCDGQLLPISQYTALFSILGTTYGGDGRTTFGLPDLQGRVPMHAGLGPGLSSRPLGQKSGQEDVALTINQIPQHSHPVQVAINNGDGEESNVAGNYISNSENAFNEDPIPGQNLAGVTAGNAGGSQSHNNMQPYTVLNFVICLNGVYPSRN